MRLDAREISRILVALLLATACAAVQASAQESDRAFLTVTPLGANGFLLGDAFDPIPVDGGEEGEVAFSFEDGLGYGLSVAARVSDRLSLEVLGNRLRSSLSASAGSLRVGFDLAYYGLYGGGLYRLRSATDAARPYLAAGVGARWYDFDAFDSTERDLAWNVGGGLEVDTGWLADVRLDLRDYMSILSVEETELSSGEEVGGDSVQHDVILNVGLAFDLF